MKRYKETQCRKSSLFCTFTSLVHIYKTNVHLIESFVKQLSGTFWLVFGDLSSKVRNSVEDRAWLLVARLTWGRRWSLAFLRFNFIWLILVKDGTRCRTGGVGVIGSVICTWQNNSTLEIDRPLRNGWHLRIQRPLRYQSRMLKL